MTTFDELDLPEALRKALVKMNFTTPTPIQAQAIPLALEGKDVIGSAQTGTGKTAAFSLPMINTLIRDEKSIALVLVPTRELAEQVWKVTKELSVFVPSIKPALIIGGVAMRPQVAALAGKARVIIATPGRLIDHLGQKTVNLANVHFLVLDEADRMLDMGFASQLERILRYLPAKRQSVLFSATLPPNILALSKKFLTDPAQVSVGQTNQAATTIDQKVLKVAADKKNDALLDEVNARTGSILVFARTKSRVDRINKFLTGYGVAVDRIHGDRSQGQRTRAIADLRSGDIRVLVATDIAARGLDVSQVTHVINYDLPMDPEDYVHRIGRTGRNGRSGEALSFVTNDDRDTWKQIERLLLKSKATSLPIESIHESFSGRDRVAGDSPQRPDRRGGRNLSRGGHARPTPRGSRGGGGGDERRADSRGGARAGAGAARGSEKSAGGASRPGGRAAPAAGSRSETGRTSGRSGGGARPHAEARGPSAHSGERRSRDESFETRQGGPKPGPRGPQAADARGPKRQRSASPEDRRNFRDVKRAEQPKMTTKRSSKFGQFMDRFKKKNQETRS